MIDLSCSYTGKMATFKQQSHGTSRGNIQHGLHTAFRNIRDTKSALREVEQ